MFVGGERVRGGTASGTSLAADALVGGLLGNGLDGLAEAEALGYVDGEKKFSDPSPQLQFDRAAVSVTAAIDALLFGNGPAALYEKSPTHALYGDLLTRASDYPLA